MTDNTSFRPGSMVAVGWPRFHAIARAAGITLPIEQTAAWDAFDAAMEDRAPWGRVLYQDADGTPGKVGSKQRCHDVFSPVAECSSLLASAQ